MAESMESLFRRGAISSKQMGRMAKPAILKKTKPGVPAKMAKFDGKSKDEGKAHGKGIPEMSIDQINERAVQDTGGSFGMGGRRGPPSKGGRAGAERQFKGGQINDSAMQKPAFPKGGKMKANGKRVGVKGGVKPTAPQSRYGDPPSRKYG